MGQYKPETANQRKNIYTGVIVVGGLVIATLVTLGIISLDQVEEYITLTVTAVGILGGVAGLVGGALARKNVEAPVIEHPPEPRHEA